jgi:hypothetical protein
MEQSTENISVRGSGLFNMKPLKLSVTQQRYHLDEVDGDHESGNGDDQRKRGNPLVRMLRSVTKKNDPEKKKNVTIEMLQPSRYKPSDLNQMAEDTKFTKSKSQF